MPSKTDICNMALAHIGHSTRITDLDSETSVAAINCRLFYDHCVNTLLEMQEWGFARRRVTLSSLGSPPSEWGYRYDYPNFCKLAIRIVNPAMRTPGRGDKIPFIVVDKEDSYGSAILTDQANAVLIYNYAITDPTLFSASFVNALAYYLATLLVMPLRVDSGIAGLVEGKWLQWQAEAGAHSFRESQEDPEPDSEFVTGRG